jgi:uncharacterized membrane protein YbhN (UPF0104 family)
LESPGRIAALVASLRHPVLVLLGSGGVLLGVLVYLTHVAGHARIVRVVGVAEPEWFLLCLAAQGVAYVGYAFALRETAHVDAGPRFGIRHTAHIVAAGFGAVFSTSAIGGFRVDYLALRHAGIGHREAVSRIVSLGALEYAVLAPAAMFSAIAVIVESGHHVQPSMTWPWLAVAPGALIAAWATQPERAQRWSRVSLADGRCPKAVDTVVGGLRLLRLLLMRPRQHGLAFVGIATYWFGEILCLWAALMAFRAPVAVPVLILGFAAGHILTRRSFPAGGIGLTEIALTFALFWLGVPFTRALLAVLVYRCFSFWLALVPAFAARGTVQAIRSHELTSGDSSRSTRKLP